MLVEIECLCCVCSLSLPAPLTIDLRRPSPTMAGYMSESCFGQHVYQFVLHAYLFSFFCLCYYSRELYHLRSWYEARHSQRLIHTPKKGQPFSDHLTLDENDQSKSVSQVVGCASTHITIPALFHVDADHDCGIDVSPILADKGAGRVAGLNADFQCSSAIMLLLHQHAASGDSFTLVGHQWASLLLGGRGGFYMSRRTEQIFISLGCRGHGALLLGPIEPTYRLEEKPDESHVMSEYFILTEERVAEMAVSWAFTYNVYLPSEPLASHQWYAVPTALRLPHQLRAVGLDHCGLVHQRIGKNTDLISHHIKMGYPLPLSFLQHLSKEIGLKPGIIPPERSVTVNSHMVELIKCVFHDLPVAEQFKLFEAYQSLKRANKKDIAADTPGSFSTMMSVLGEDEANKFQRVSNQLKERELDAIVQDRLQRHRQAELLRKDPEAATPHVYRQLKPPKPGCALIVDAGNTSYQAYYIRDAPGESTSCSFLKKRPQNFALYQAVDFLWGRHQAHGGSQEGKPTIAKMDEVLEIAEKATLEFKETFAKNLEKAFMPPKKKSGSP